MSTKPLTQEQLKSIAGALKAANASAKQGKSKLTGHIADTKKAVAGLKQAGADFKKAEKLAKQAGLKVDAKKLGM